MVRRSHCAGPKLVSVIFSIATSGDVKKFAVSLLFVIAVTSLPKASDAHLTAPLETSHLYYQEYADNPWENEAEDDSISLSYPDDTSGLASKRRLEYSFGLGKRSQDFSFGLGKRRDDFSFGLGKRNPDFSFGLGKRDGPKDFSFGLGKRGGPKDFSFGLGKRGKPKDFSFGLGKRGGPKDFSFGLGKRGGPKDFSFGLGKRGGPKDFSFGLGKRGGPKDFSFGLGKRGGPENYSFGLGKRSGPKEFSFGLGKRNLGIHSFGLGKRDTESSEGRAYYTDDVMGRVPQENKKSKPFSFGLGKRSIDETKSTNPGAEALNDNEHSRQKRQVNFENLVDYDDLGTNDLENEFYAEKRKNRYQFGIGKRSDPMYYISYSSEDYQQDPESLTEDSMSKRTPDRFSFGLGKRSRNYEFGLGKRDDDVQDQTSTRYLTQANSQEGYSGYPFNRRSFNFGLGKRARAATLAELIKKNIKDFSFGLGKRSGQKSKPLQRSYNFGLGKRQDSSVQSLRPGSFAFGLGK